jgi:hypothetical protein
VLLMDQNRNPLAAWTPGRIPPEFSLSEPGAFNTDCDIDRVVCTGGAGLARSSARPSCTHALYSAAYFFPGTQAYLRRGTIAILFPSAPI